LDVGLKNGTLYGGVFAVSFETGSPKSQQRDTDAIAFALDDVKSAQPDANLAVLVLPPRPVTPTYLRAEHIFKELHAKTLIERQLPAWATSLVQQIPEDALHKPEAP
jgi:hypothetical protein